MSGRYSQSPSTTATASSSGGGCLSGMLLPPLAVVIVGAMLAFFALGPFNPPASAELSNPERVMQGEPGKSAISPIFTPEVQFWARGIQAWAEAAGLDPNLAATVMQIESCGDPLAHSRAGAMGLFQVMPDHFVAGEDAYDPDINARRGMDYLSRSLDAAEGDPRLALAGYNGGIGVIGRVYYSWSGETQAYAAWGSGIYQDAVSGASISPHLQDWLRANGISLCRQAAARLGLNP